MVWCKQIFYQIIGNKKYQIIKAKMINQERHTWNFMFEAKNLKHQKELESISWKGGATRHWL